MFSSTILSANSTTVATEVATSSATFDFFSIIGLLGGLALFLYGMNVLGNGLEKVSGGHLQRILEKLTNNIFKSVLLGAIVTAAIQSSSATTVIIVGLVNSRILKLRQAIGVIMGANIGTTVTAHILRLGDISSDNFFMQIIKPSTLAPVASIIGILLVLASKRDHKKQIGLILLGFGVLFTGMFAMEDAVSPLKEMPQMADLFTAFSNPVLGVLVGALVTAIIQSSSASVGILQALSSTGAITYASAFPIIMGQNIGTCITPILASIGASKNAKRSAVVHLSFNILGTILFLIAVYAINAFFPFQFWNEVIDKGGIANVHTAFNIIVTLSFIPFARALEKLAKFIVRDNEDDIDEYDITSELDDRFLVSPGLALNHSREAVLKMSKLAKDNFLTSCSLIKSFDSKVYENSVEIENVLDKFEDKLNAYLLKLSQRDLNEKEGKEVTLLLHIIGEYERIGDYSMNILEEAENLHKENLKFSEQGLSEIDAMGDAVAEILDKANICFEHNDTNMFLQIEPLEDIVDLMQKKLKSRHIDRLKSGSCSVDAAFPFVETLANLERISDHCSNIALFIATHDEPNSTLPINMHIKSIDESNKEFYKLQHKTYYDKYYSRISSK